MITSIVNKAQLYFMKTVSNTKAHSLVCSIALKVIPAIGRWGCDATHTLVRWEMHASSWNMSAAIDSASSVAEKSLAAEATLLTLPMQ